MKKEDIKNYEIIRVQLANMLADRINAVVSQADVSSLLCDEFYKRAHIIADYDDDGLMIYTDDFLTSMSDDTRCKMNREHDYITLFNFEDFLNPKSYFSAEKQIGFYLMLADAILDDMCKENRLYVDVREDDGEDDDE